MTQQQVGSATPSLVPGVHRVVRQLQERDGPFDGVLVADGDDVVVSVDAAALRESEIWRYAGSEHVLGVADVARRVDGQDVLLPWCTETIVAFLRRRTAADAPLGSGEVGTLVVSLLRGLGELGDDDPGGEWWLTHRGRPMFVHAPSGEDAARTARTAREGAVQIVGRLLESSTDRALRRVLNEVADGIGRPRLRRADSSRWEEGLFEIAAPRSLRTEDIVVAAPPPEPPTRRGARSPGAVAVRGRNRREQAGHARRPARRPGRRRASSGLTGDALDRVLGVLDRVRAIVPRPARERPPSARSHRRPLLVGAAVAAVVIGAGMLWPANAAQTGGDGAGGSSRAAAHGGSADTERSGAEANDGVGRETDGSEIDQGPEAGESETGPEQGAPPTAAPKETATAPPGSPLAAVPHLLDSLAGCAATADTTCRQALASGSALPGDGVALRGREASTATMVDDYGDLAVIRLTPVDPGMHAQMLVLVRQKKLWLVRDVYDVADQPE